MNRCHSCVALLAMTLALTAARAQTSALTLEHAVELATANAPQLQARAAALEAAQAQAIAAGRLPDPELIVGLENVPVTSADAWSLSSDFMTMRKLGVMQSVPNGRKRAADRRVAQAGVDLARAETQQTELELARAAAEAWIDVHVTEQLEANLRALRPELQLQSEAVNAAVRAGRSSATEALSAQAAVLDLDDQLIAAQRDVRSARAMLARWIGEEGAALPLAGAPGFDELPRDRTTLLTALHRHASLLAFQSRIQLAESEVEQARADKRPDWSAEVAYARRGAAFSDMVSLQFRVDLPFFAGQRQDPVIRSKHAQLAELQAEREAEVRMHAQEVATALAEWEGAHAQLELYERERLPIARARSQTSLASFRAGASSLADVTSSFAAEVQLQRSRAQLIRELGYAWAYMRYLSTQETAP